MKSLRYILPAIGLALFVSLFSACVDDDGNYSYLSDEDAGEIIFDTIGIENRYALSYYMSKGDTIIFEPNVTYKYPERLRYRWFYLTLTNYSYTTVLVGNSYEYPAGDTISYAKRLEWVCDLDAGQYRFYLMAEDTVTGMRGYYQAGQYVTIAADTELDGLYILSEVDGQTDLEVLTSTLMLIYGGDATYPRHYSDLKGEFLKGKPKFIRGTHTGGTSVNGMMVCTDENMYRIALDGLEIMDEWEDMFYDVPENFAPQNCFYSQNGSSRYCEFLINDGKVHTLYTTETNDRKFSTYLAGDYEAGDFLMFKPKYYRSSSGVIDADQVIYDKENSKFRPYYAKRSSISSFSTTEASAVLDANNLPAEPKMILNGYNSQTYVIIEVDGTYYLYRFQFYNVTDDGDLSYTGSSNSITDLSGCTDIDQAKYYASNTNAQAFYYATDKGVYSFSPTSGQTTSNTIYTCESNEVVTAMYAGGSIGGGWPTSSVILWVALWDETAQEGKILEYEMDHSYGIPQSLYGPMFGGTGENPTITTGWGKVVGMVCLDAE